MANFDGSFYSFTPAFLDSTDMGPQYVGDLLQVFPSLLRFKMRGKNSLSAVVTWIVAGEPDTSAAQYTGGNTPITNISVAATWTP
jgi:hypothetical protein